MMKIVVPALDQMLLDNRIGIDEANCIIVTRMVPVDLAHSLGVLVSPGPSVSFDTYHQQQQMPHFQTALPLSRQQYHHHHAQQQPQPVAYTTQSHIPSIASCAAGTVSTIAGPMSKALSGAGGSISGTASPIASYYGGGPNGGGGSSPMHQITKGISGLSTSGGGSITRGTSACVVLSSDMASDKPLDLSMDVSSSSNCPTSSSNTASAALDTTASSISTVGMLYDLATTSTTTTQQLPAGIVAVTAGSPNLCSIQEEQQQQQQNRIFMEAPTTMVDCTAMQADRNTVNICYLI